MTITNNKSILFGLIIIAILAVGFVAFVPDTASAEGGRNVHFGPMGDEEDERETRVSSDVSDGVGGRNVRVNYSFPSGDEEQPVLRNTTVGSTLNSGTRVETESVEGQDEGREFSSLAANALFGGSTFLPSGVTQWILFIIFILLLVIMVRRIMGAEQAYHASPLKHD